MGNCLLRLSPQSCWTDLIPNFLPSSCSSCKAEIILEKFSYFHLPFPLLLLPFHTPHYFSRTVATDEWRASLQLSLWLTISVLWRRKRRKGESKKQENILVLDSWLCHPENHSRRNNRKECGSHQLTCLFGIKFHSFFSWWRNGFMSLPHSKTFFPPCHYLKYLRIVWLSTKKKNSKKKHTVSLPSLVFPFLALLCILEYVPEPGKKGTREMTGTEKCPHLKRNTWKEERRKKPEEVEAREVVFDNGYVHFSPFFIKQEKKYLKWWWRWWCWWHYCIVMVA